MRIAAISSICPVPELYPDNDIILNFYQHLLRYYPDVEVRVIRPVVYCNSVMARMKSSWKRYYEIGRIDKYTLKGIAIYNAPFPFCSNASAIYWPLSKLAWAFSARQICRSLHDFEYDLIHAHRISIDGVLAHRLSRASKRPYVVSSQREADRFRNAIERNLSRSVLRHASAITSLSPFAARQIAQHCSVDSEVIPYGIDEKFFADMPSAARIPGPRLRFIAVCRLLPLKNIDLVLRAIKSNGLQHRCKFTIIGDGPERPRLEEITRDLALRECVTFLGTQNITEVRRHMMASDVFIMPSSPESFGLVYGEAFACGLPTICARDNGFDGHFTNGREGFAVDINGNELSQVMAKLVSTPGIVTEMSKSVLKIARKFSWKRSCNRYMEIFEEVAAPGE